MGNQNNRKLQSRPASTPVPQGNQSARLLNPDGTEKSSGQLAREAREAERNREAGQEIFSRLRLGVPSGEANGSVVDRENGKTFSQSMIDKLASLYQKANDSAAFIRECEDRKEKYSKSAKANVGLFQDAFIEWAKSFTPENEKLVYANGAGSIHLDSSSDAIAKTATQWLYNLCKLSNNALFGNDAKYGRPVETGKNPKPSMFDDVKRGAKMAGFTVSNNERIKGKAAIQYTAEDSEGKIRESISEIADAARRYNRADLEGAGSIVYRLVNDVRFGLDDQLVTGLIQARLDGIQVAGLTEAIDKANEQKEAFLNAIGLDAALQADADKMLARLKEQKAEQKEFSGVGGTRFHLPESEPTEPQVMKSITWEDKAEKRIHAEALKIDATMTDEKLDEITQYILTLSKDSAEETFSFDDPANFEHAFNREWLKELINEQLEVEETMAATTV